MARKKIKHNCKLCGKLFYDWVSNHRVYCSRSCLAKDKYTEKLGKISHTHLLGSRNHNWRGDNVGYSGIHMWIKKEKGKPDKCEHCGKTTGDIQWANVSGYYKRDVSDFISLCVPCHRAFDGVVVENPSYNTLYMRTWRKGRIIV